MLGDVNNFFVFKSLLTTPSNVLPLHLKQTFPPIIWIFTEGKGDGIKFRLPFKIFSTLQVCNLLLIQFARVNKHSKIFTRISLLYINNFVIFIYLFKIERRVWKKEWLYWFLTICQNYTYSVDCQWRLGRSIPFWRSTL